MWASPGETGGRRVKASALTDAFVLGRVGLLVQLQLRLDVLGGEGDADLDAAGDAAYNETQISAEGGGGGEYEKELLKSQGLHVDISHDLVILLWKGSSDALKKKM